ncbi:Ig-like domain-containing protein [Maribacter sp. 2307UL18-2]|uniref:Ig-like domain-containing protein n=1 Tax=Maribacter sp. 2307UL18-2 TaxID=3386274 RepID=UPI0039BD362D
MKKLLLAIAFFGMTSIYAQSTIYADIKYGFNASDATINFYDALVGEKGTGNTLVFRDMGSPWIVSPCYRIFDLDDIDIVFEEGFVLQESSLYANKDDRRRYINLTKLKNNYPNGTEIIRGPNNENTNNGDYDLFPNTKLIYVLRADNTNVTAYGAEFIGTFPTKNVGLDPAGDTQDFDWDHSYEFGHFVQIEDSGNFTWKGGYIRQWAGDALNCEGIEAGKTFLVEDVKASWNKRLGISHIKGEGDFVIKDCILEENGMGPNGEFGTNTLQGITIEPNFANQTAHFEGHNLSFVRNADSGIGLQLTRPEARQGQSNISVVLNGVHFEDNTQQEDNTGGGAMTLQGTDRFNRRSSSPSGSAVYGDLPLGGYMVFSNVAVWGDYEGFASVGQYGNNYTMSFDETVCYKVSTTGGVNSRNVGDAVIEWEVGSLEQPNTICKNFDIGNFLVIHEFDEPFIMFKDFPNITAIDGSVTGNLTVASPNTQDAIVVKNLGGLSNNNTISKTQYALNALPGNTVSVVASVSEAVKSSATNGEFTFTRTGPTDFPMAVAYDVATSGANAEMLNDFKLLRGSVVIPTGQTSVTLPVIPLNPNRTGGTRNITLTIQPKADLYTVGQNSIATVNLVDVGGAGSQVSTFSPIHDAHLQGSTLYNQPNVRVDEGSRVTYLKYDLSAVTGTITDAELLFRIGDDVGVGTMEVYLGTNTGWTETTLSSANKPLENGLLGSTTDLGQATNDVLVPLSETNLTGGGELSLIVKHVGSNDFSMASKENTTKPPVRLVLTYGSASNVPVTGVTVAPSTLNVSVGNDETVTATIAPSNATDQGVTWSSNDTTIATVDANGTVTGVATGSAAITVTTDDGSFTASSNVTVSSSAPIVSNITVSDIMQDSFKVSWNLNEGSKGRIEYGTSSGNYTEQTTSEENFLTFHIQTVGNNNAPPLQAGTIYYWRIRTEDNAGNIGYSDEQMTTTVGILVTGVSVAPTTLTMNIGDTSPITATIIPSNATDQGVTWSSDDTAVATVNTIGIVTAVAPGSATITATTDDGSFTASSNITVSSSAPTVTSIAVSNILEDSFKVSWNLDEGSKGRIEYGTSSGNYTEQTTSEENFLTFHIQTVGNNNAPPLQSATTHYWRIRTEDVNGNVGYSDEQTTTTNTPAPQTTTFDPIHDAYLQGSTRINNTHLKVEQGSRVSYMKFDLSSVNGTISSAELRFRVNGDTGTGTAEIYKGTASSWTETNLSTSNRPSKNGLLGSTTDIGQTTTEVIVPLSVTTLTGGGDLSLIIEHVGSSDFWMASDENTSVSGPQLEITYTPSSGSSLMARVDFDNSDSVLGIASLFPNPTTSEVQLYGIDGEKEITVIDFSGKLLMEATSKEAEPVIDLSGYAPGIYYMRVESSGISKTFKVVKQ